jgi:hypothetical protein
MVLFSVVYFVWICISLSYLWSFSEILKPCRIAALKIPLIKKPLECPECTSFWIGVLFSFLYNPIILNVNLPLCSNVICGVVAYFSTSVFYRKFLL